MTSPYCHNCGKSAEEVFTDSDEREGVTPAEYARMDGTYNPENNRFCCTLCYIKLGCPSRPGEGWKAP